MGYLYLSASVAKGHQKERGEGRYRNESPDLTSRYGGLRSGGLPETRQNVGGDGRRRLLGRELTPEALEASLFGRRRSNGRIYIELSFMYNLSISKNSISQSLLENRNK